MFVQRKVSKSVLRWTMQRYIFGQFAMLVRMPVHRLAHHVQCVNLRDGPIPTAEQYWAVATKPLM